VHDRLQAAEAAADHHHAVPSLVRHVPVRG
jgi:hypothetical protein